MYGEIDCLIGIVTTNDDYFLFGDVFLREFYSIWDDEGAKLGLVPHKHTTATMLIGNKPTQVLQIDDGDVDLG